MTKNSQSVENGIPLKPITQDRIQKYYQNYFKQFLYEGNFNDVKDEIAKMSTDFFQEKTQITSQKLAEFKKKMKSIRDKAGKEVFPRFVECTVDRIRSKYKVKLIKSSEKTQINQPA